MLLNYFNYESHWATFERFQVLLTEREEERGK